MGWGGGGGEGKGVKGRRSVHLKQVKKKKKDCIHFFFRGYSNWLPWQLSLPRAKLVFRGFFFFFAFPSYISGVHHFWVRFLRM